MLFLMNNLGWKLSQKWFVACCGMAVSVISEAYRALKRAFMMGLRKGAPLSHAVLSLRSILLLRSVKCCTPKEAFQRRKGWVGVLRDPPPMPGPEPRPGLNLAPCSLQLVSRSLGCRTMAWARAETAW